MKLARAFFYITVVMLAVVFLGPGIMMAIGDYLGFAMTKAQRSYAAEHATKQVVVENATPYPVEWPARPNPKAPALKLMVPIAEFSAWQYMQRPSLSESATGPIALDLHAAIPSNEQFSTALFPKWCKGKEYSPQQCLPLQIRVNVQKEPDQNLALVQGGTIRAHQTREPFWVKEDADGPQFLGWNCQDSPQSLATNQPLPERDHCAQPPFWQRILPGRAPQSLAYFHSCEYQQNCGGLFLYSGRLVSFSYNLPEAVSRPELAHWAFFVVWERMARLSADTRTPPTPAVWLRRANSSLKNCQVLAEMEQNKENKAILQPAIDYQCRYALQQVLNAKDVMPVESAQLVLDVFDRISPQRWDTWSLEAVRGALAKSPKAPPLMLAKMNYATVKNQVVQWDKVEEIKGAWLEAARAASAADPLSAFTLEVFTGLSQSPAFQTPDPQRLVALEQWTNAVAAQRPNDPIRLKSLALWCQTSMNQRDQAQLKTCADRAYEIWHSATEALTVSVRAEQIDDGLNVLNWYVVYGYQSGNLLDVKDAIIYIDNKLAQFGLDAERLQRRDMLMTSVENSILRRTDDYGQLRRERTAKRALQFGR